ncbi:hypothetical protein BFJ68_g1622 [Fusarium oxysporum]|uniref:Uncharacterized protein n=1 Tax=Fusarium oxysporum TaxID=5507 RepID=A0A420RZE0_FUSOX|nr:hypothetical protein BFJ71_g2661 [Fusarium oxysporum]RKL22375.1 hypothetical protein BFJ68_g1622 [Fusarium oxysporum]
MDLSESFSSVNEEHVSNKNEASSLDDVAKIFADQSITCTSSTHTEAWQRGNPTSYSFQDRFM